MTEHIPSTPIVPPALLDPVVAYFRPRRVILFGSQARGDAHEDSDYDLLVIVDDDTPPEKLTLKAGYEAKRGCGYAADVFPVRESIFQRRRHIVGTLSEAAETDGKVVYERE
ncbi:MAG: nucleotidyltransferase domain-containing protein [Alphaproteobacteria bacterium]